MKVDAVARAAAHGMSRRETLVLGGIAAGAVAVGIGVVAYGRRDRPVAALSAELVSQYDRGGRGRDRAIRLDPPTANQASELVRFQRDQGNLGDWFGSGVWWQREQLFRDADLAGTPDGLATEPEVAAILRRFDTDGDRALTSAERRPFDEAYRERRARPSER